MALHEWQGLDIASKSEKASPDPPKTRPLLGGVSQRQVCLKTDGPPVQKREMTNPANLERPLVSETCLHK